VWDGLVAGIKFAMITVAKPQRLKPRQLQQTERVKFRRRLAVSRKRPSTVSGLLSSKENLNGVCGIRHVKMVFK
jgi:hypothetical protein